MEGKDHIKDLFNEKLAQFEAPVRPELWSGIASQIGTAAPAAASTGLTVASKIIIGLSVAASLSVGAYFIFKDGNEGSEVKSAENKITSIKDNTITPTEEDASKENLVFENKEENNKIETNEEENPEQELNPVDEIVESAENKKGDELIFINESNEKQKDQIKEQALINKTESQEGNKVENNEEQLHPIVEEIKESDVVLDLPNVFSPNGDGVHEELFIRDASYLTEFNLVVLSLNNQVVYTTNDPDFKWNGYSINNEKVTEGDYIYYVTARDSKGRPVAKYSRLRIITTK